MYTKSVVAAALLSAAPSVLAQYGDAIVQNSCSFPVYLWSVANVAGPEVIVPAGSNYTEQYRTNPNGGGISIKIAADSAAAKVTQLEYTLDTTDLWYDVSNINGYPFEQWGLTLVPSDATCASVTCDAGVAQCKDVYNQSNDDAATHFCESSADMVMVLCPGNVAVASGIASSVASIASSTKAAKASSTPASTTMIVAVKTTSSKSSSVQATPSSTEAAKTTSTEAPKATSTEAVATSSDSAVVYSTTFVTTYVTVGAGSTSTVKSTTELVTTVTSTKDRHNHTFSWPAFTGFPGAKVRRNHQHMHHAAHHQHA